MKTANAYDIIGDIHGHADELEALLARLGYKKVNKAYRHGDGAGDFSW